MKKKNPLPFGLTPYQATMSAIGVAGLGVAAIYVYQQSKKPVILPVTTSGGGNGTTGGGTKTPPTPVVTQTWTKQTVSPFAVQPGTSILVSMFDPKNAAANANVASAFTKLGLTIVGTWTSTDTIPSFWPADDLGVGRIRYQLLYPSGIPASITLNLDPNAMNIYVSK